MPWKSKNRFLASATHDLRQPVHALALYADWLRGEPDLVREIAPKIVEATKAVNALFDSLFDFARLDSGQTKLNIGPVNLSTLMHDLEVQYRPLAQAKGSGFQDAFARRRCALRPDFVAAYCRKSNFQRHQIHAKGRVCWWLSGSQPAVHFGSRFGIPEWA
jgi:signal transduction histidine kinase